MFKVRSMQLDPAQRLTEATTGRAVDRHGNAAIFEADLGTLAIARSARPGVLLAGNKLHGQLNLTHEIPEFMCDQPIINAAHRAGQFASYLQTNFPMPGAENHLLPALNALYQPNHGHGDMREQVANTPHDYLAQPINPVAFGAAPQPSPVLVGMGLHDNAAIPQQHGMDNEFAVVNWNMPALTPPMAHAQNNNVAAYQPNAHDGSFDTNSGAAMLVALSDQSLPQPPHAQENYFNFSNPVTQVSSPLHASPTALETADAMQGMYDHFAPSTVNDFAAPVQQAFDHHSNSITPNSLDYSDFSSEFSSSASPHDNQAPTPIQNLTMDSLRSNALV